MNAFESGAIDAVHKSLENLLSNGKPELVEIDDCPDTVAGLVAVVNELQQSLIDIQRFILPLSQGMLQIEPPKAANRLASPFKELHSQLRGLVWQVQQVAKGDYKQRVQFMGDFSTAFNSLVETLDQKSRLLNEQISLLQQEAHRLLESTMRYLSAVKYAPGGVLILDPASLRIIESNIEVQRILGYDEGELGQARLADIYNDPAVAETDIPSILRKSMHTISSRELAAKSGKPIYSDIYTCWSDNTEGSVVIANIIDVTSRNKALAVLNRYKILSDQVRDIILFIRDDGLIIEANKAAELAFGYTSDELRALGIYRLSDDRFGEIIKDLAREEDPNSLVFETIYRRKDGSLFPVEVSLQATNLDGERIWVIVSRDISERKRTQDELRYLATHDPLTRVPNRKFLEERISEYLSDGKRRDNGALLLIDVDNFKVINDTFGHAVGDQFLVDVAATLRKNLRRDDVLARLGGDEFAIFLKEITMKDVKIVAEKLRAAVEKADIVPGDSEVHFITSISIGVAPIGHRKIEMRDILPHADYALYQAKDQGRNRVSYAATSNKVKSKLSKTKGMLRLIKEGIEKDSFVLRFQPIRNTKTGEIIHHECLLRIIDESGIIVSPADFIPVAEQFGLMINIDRKVITMALDTLENYPSVCLFVNLSGVSLGDESLLDYIEENIRNRGIKPSRLGFEITETAAVRDLSRAVQWIRRLKKMGCLFAIDDFGIGFSSFSYLQVLPVDYVKIDGSYIRDMYYDDKHLALVKAMNTVALSLGKKTIAESVESDILLEKLKELEVSHAQGFYMGRPEVFPSMEPLPANLNTGGVYYARYSL